MNRSLLALAAGACLAATALPAAATTYDFGQVLSGTGPNASFASLSVTAAAGSDGDDWLFTLTAGNMASIFGVSKPFIGSMAVDAGNYGGFKGSITSVSGGVTTIGTNPGAGPGGNAWDFRFTLGKGQDRLTSNETVTWIWKDSKVNSFVNFALHVQGLDGNKNGYSSSLWYVPSNPVPEPETYALMLAGLGAMGFIARRRRG